MSGREELLKYDILWADCVEEEARLAAKHGGHHDDNQALAIRWKGKKKKSFPRKNQEGKSDNTYDKRLDNKNQDGKSNDRKGQRPSKVQCFGCHGYGHIRRDCPSINDNHHLDKRQRQRASRAEIEEPSSKRSRRVHSSDSNYLLLSALSGTVQTSRDTWLIDSGASRHMIGYGELLFDLVKREN